MFITKIQSFYGECIKEYADAHYSEANRLSTVSTQKSHHKYDMVALSFMGRSPKGVLPPVGGTGAAWRVGKSLPCLIKGFSRQEENVVQKQSVQRKGVQDKRYAICGRGFPILIGGMGVGSFCVSGLTREQDYRLIIDAFRKFQGKL